MAELTPKTYITLLKGFITEATNLTFPSDSAKDIDNIVIGRTGVAEVRQGVDFESGYSLMGSYFSNLVPESTLAFTSDMWTNVANIPNKNFAVIQVGSTLYFVDTSVTPLSSGIKSFTVNLSTYSSSGTALVPDTRVSMTSGKGVLVVSAKGLKPIYITYNVATDTITTTAITIKVRDLEGITESVAVDNRPSSLTDTHKYNLLNQGWDTTKITAFQASQTTYPSNADIWYLGRDSSNVFSPTELVKQDFGTAQAPKGRFIFEAFNKDRATVSGISGLTAVTTTSRPTCVAFYAGRIFYSGYNGTLYYSQVIKDDISNIGLCHQEADPTSEHISDLIATDGGTIALSDINEFIKLVVMGNKLVVIGSNGVWAITGADGIFKATDYSISKVSEVGALSSSSVAIVNGAPMWWNDSMYGIVTTQFGDIQVEDIGIKTIKTFINDIPLVSRINGTAVYNSVERKVFWFYNEDATTQYRQRYNKVLIFDTTLGAFTKYTISTLTNMSPYICSALSATIVSEDVIINNVVDGLGNQVVDGSGNHVSSRTVRTVSSTQEIQLLTVVPSANGSKITFSTFNRDDFIDWYTIDSTGKTYDAYILQSPELNSDAIRDKQAMYVVCYFDRTEDGFTFNGIDYDLTHPSSCYMSSYWDFASNSYSNKITTEWQVYRLNRNYVPDGNVLNINNGFNTVKTKNRLTGVGRSVQIKFRNEPGKNFRLLGWCVVYEGRTKV